MGLKYIIESTDGLEEPIAKLYTKGDDGKFRLGVEGVEPEESVRGLKAKVEELLSEKKTAKEQADAAQRKLEEEAAEKLRRSGDVEAIEKSYKKEIEKLKKESADAVSEREKELDSLVRKAQVSNMLEGKVDPMAKKWIERDILERTRLEVVDGKRLIRVLDEDGKPTAQSLEEFVKSNVFDNADYSKYVIGSRAAGGGADGNPRGGGAGAEGKTITSDAFGKLTLAEQRAFFKDKGHIKG